MPATNCIQCDRELMKDQRCVCPECWSHMPVMLHAMWAKAVRPKTQASVIRMVERHVAELKASMAELEADAELGRQRIAEMEKA